MSRGKRSTKARVRRKPIQLEFVREGKDEMNLAVFPIAALYSRIPRNVKSLKFQDTIIGENGKLVRRSWTVQGGSEVGLPTSTDEDVYVALMELARKEGFDDQRVSFSRYDLVKRLGWCPCGKCYQRLEESLLRLSSVSIHAQNAFWDNQAKAYVTAGFTLIQGYHLYDEPVGRKAGLTRPLSWIMWSDQLHRSFKSGYIKFLDTNLYFKLSTATARRLYRYLDKKFGNEDRFSINIFRLAHEHLGISRNFRYVSEVLRQLRPALDELTEAGYLKSWKLEEQVMSFVKSKAAKHEPFDTTDEQLYRTLDLPFDSVKVIEERTPLQEEIVRMLTERGVTSSQARKLIEAKAGDLASIEGTIRYFDSLMGRSSKKISNPAGLLVTLIKEGRFDSAPAVEAGRQERGRNIQRTMEELAYQDFIDKEVDKFIESEPAEKYAGRLEEKKQELLQSERGQMYRRWAKQVFDDYASILCRRDIARELKLPDFAAWLSQKGEVREGG